jgi:CDP-glycerol glycerophosphotransferase
MPYYPRMPLLSIVMAAHNTETYIVPALESLAIQQWPNFEVLVIDDGSTDNTAKLAQDFAEHHKRFSVHCIDQVGPGAARNAGVELAKGKYLTFFDSDDLANPFFYLQAIFSLERSGSDFALGSYQILKDGEAGSPPPYIRELHRRTRRRIKLADRPDVMTNALMCTRVYRRSFYDAHVGPQPEGIFFENQLLTMRAFVQARRFDLLHESALLWRRRASFDSTTQRAADVENLQQRIDSYQQVAAYLEEIGEVEVRQARLMQILATNQLTLSHLLVAGEDYLDLTRRFLAWAIAEIGDDYYAERVTPRDLQLHNLVLDGDLPKIRTFLFTNARSLGQWVFGVRSPIPASRRRLSPLARAAQWNAYAADGSI